MWSLGYLVEWNSVDGLNKKSMWVDCNLKEPFIPSFITPTPQEEDAQSTSDILETQATTASA